MIEAAQILIGLSIGWRSLLAINAMNERTHHIVRALHLSLATCAAWIALDPFFPRDWGELPQLSALAMYLAIEFVDRRRQHYESLG